MKTIGLCGLGNAIIDLLLEVGDEEFESLGLTRSGMQLVDVGTQALLLKQVHATRDELVFKSGGSVANSVIAYSQLGGKGAFLGSVGDDPMGEEYEREMKEVGVACSLSVVPGGATGTSLIFITPDAERTMNTCLGCAGDFNADLIDGDVIASSKWLLLEGYLFANPHGGEGAIMASIEHAVKGNTKIAFTCSDNWVVSAFFDKIKGIMPRLSLLVANESEAMELARRWVEANPHHFNSSTIEGAEDAMDVLRRLVPECVITLGAKGALLAHKDHVEHVAAFPCTPVDLTGAGDAFIGTYLNARNDGHSMAESGSLACFVASKVVTQIGPRLQDPAWLLSEWKQDRKTPLHTAELRS